MDCICSVPERCEILQAGEGAQRAISRRGEMSTQQGERRVLRAGTDAAAASGHHRTTGQGVHRQTYYQLPSPTTSLQ